MSSRFAIAVLAASLAGCAAQVAPPAASPSGDAAVTAFPMPGAIASERVEAAVEALRGDLSQRLAEHRLAVTRGGDSSLRLRFDAEASFEADSAQLRAATLLPLADCAAALHGAGAFVVLVRGQAADAAAVDLAERRAASVAAVLVAQGVPAARVRASAWRAAGSAQVELIYQPVVEGREARAWMAPTEGGGR